MATGAERRVVLLHYYGVQNRGDAWIVDCLRSRLGTEVQFVAATGDVEAPDAMRPPWLIGRSMSRANKAVSVLFAVWVFVAPRRLLGVGRLRGVSALYSRHGLAVSKGGSFILARKGVGGWAYLLEILSPIRLAQRLGLNTIIAGQSFGPFGSALQASLARFVLARVTTVLVRDQPSLDFVAGRADLVPDIVLAGDLSTLRHDDPKESDSVMLPGPRIIVSLVGPSYFSEDLPADAMTTIASAVARISQANGAHVRLFTQVTGPTPGDDDRPSLHELRNQLRNMEVPVSDVDASATPLAAFKDASLVISYRMHTAVAAILSQAPVVVVSYLGPKTDGLASFVDNVTVLSGGALNADGLIRAGIRQWGSASAVKPEARIVWDEALRPSRLEAGRA